MTPTSYIIIRLLVGIIASAALPVVMAFIWRKRGGLAGWQQFRENRRLRHDYWRDYRWRRGCRFPDNFRDRVWCRRWRWNGHRCRRGSHHGRQ